MTVEALLGDDLFHRIASLEHLVWFEIPQSDCEQKLPCVCHLGLHLTKEGQVFLDDGSHVGILLLFQTLGQVCTVLVGTLGGVGADQLQITDGGKHNHELLDLAFDADRRKHRDIGGCHLIKKELPIGCVESIFAEPFEPEEFLYTGTAFLFSFSVCHIFLSWHKEKTPLFCDAFACLSSILDFFAPQELSSEVICVFVCDYAIGDFGRIDAPIQFAPNAV